MYKQIMTIQNAILRDSAHALLVGGSHCHVCKALLPKLSELFKSQFPKMNFTYKVLEENQEELTSFSINSLPTLLIFFEGKEFYRFERSFSVLEVQERIERPYNLIFN